MKRKRPRIKLKVCVYKSNLVDNYLYDCLHKNTIKHTFAEIKTNKYDRAKKQN